MRSRPWLCISTMASASMLAAVSASFGQDACNSSANDCCSASPDGSAGCNDFTCCSTVCAADPFCCSTAWDGICAGEAFSFCSDLCNFNAVCGPDNPQDCCVANSAPGCSDSDCCNNVCGADPFCCTTAWDSVCATEAASMCLTLCGVPCDTTCPSGAHVEAEACGSDTNGGCNGGVGYEALTADTICGTFWADGSFRDTDWFSFTLAEPTEVTLTINTSAPAAIGLLDNTCGPIVWAFNGAAGCGGTVTACLPAGENVAFVAPGFFNGLPCGTGEFNNYVATLTFGATCEPLGCGSSTAGDCCSANPSGLPFCNDETCCSTVCGADPFCCSVAWDGICAQEAFAFCPDLCNFNAVCGPDNPQDCCVANGAPGCSDTDCCNTVCNADPFCCTTAWDSVCATEAASMCLTLCGVPCDTTCPNGAHVEAELCGEDTNGGCNGGIGYEAITAPGTVCGTFWADGSFRDTDWFSFNLPSAAEVTITINASAPSAIGLLDNTCGPVVYAFNGAASCGSTVTACLPAGENVAFVAPGFFNGLPCGTGEFNNYTITITVGGECTPLGCGSSPNDCCAANSTPFCSDADCCNTVCGFDPFCCSVAWDTICASEAASACSICGGGGGACGPDNPNDCCAANGTPGCSDTDCCNTVCAADPFCCNTAWDTICAGEAATMCSICGVDNDECTGALPITVGATPFDTTGATTSPPALDPACEEGFGLNLVNDIWYAYTATGTGSVTVSLCTGTSYDSRIAAYEGSCEDLAIVACNDDFCGLVSQMTFDTECGEVYYLRIGGFSGSGAGTITITQTGNCPSPCPADLNDDGIVGAADLALLLGAWGTAGPGDLDGSGSVGAPDLALLLGAWGPCP